MRGKLHGESPVDPSHLKRLYLDQNAWAALTEGEHNHVPLANVVDAIKSEIDAGNLIVPVDSWRLYETSRYQNVPKRQARLRFIGSISRGWFMSNEITARITELCNLGSGITGTVQVNIISQLFGKSITYLLSKYNEQRLLEDAWQEGFDTKFDIWANESNFYQFFEHPRIQDSFRVRLQTFQEVADRINQTKAILRQQHLQPQQYRSQVTFLLKTAIFKAVIHDTFEYLHQPPPQNLENPTQAQINEILDQLPSIFTFSEIISKVYQDSNNEITDHEVVDIMSLSIAIPYCNVIVCEAPMANITAQQLHLDRKFGHVVLPLNKIGDLSMVIKRN